MARIAYAALVVASLLLASGAQAGEERSKPGGSISPDSYPGVDRAQSDLLNENDFLERCAGAAALVEFVIVLDASYRETDKERVRETFREAAVGTCVFGNCSSPLTSLLTMEAIPDFYEQHCCALGETNFYVALFADGRKEWVYFNHRPIARDRLATSCR
jgi:hypothetical protein